MIKAAAIICEYNPFHDGHAYQIAALRERFPYHTAVAVMSGNFVQRAEPAIADKYVRAEAAVRSGADLVLELPFPYCCASAEYFARAGVAVAAMTGAELLCFGSASGDTAALERALAVMDSPEYASELAQASSLGQGVAAARDTAMTAVAPELAPLMRSPNDSLALEYLRALDAFGEGAPRPFAIARAEGDGYASASQIREMIRAGYIKQGFMYANDTSACADNTPVCTDKSTPRADGSPAASACRAHMPASAADVLLTAIADGAAPASFDALADAMLLSLRLCRDIDAVADAKGGIGRRLRDAALSASTLEEALAAAATKRYTNTRLRRIALFTLLSVTRAMLTAPPAYALVLAANAAGRALLREIDNPRVISKPADARALDTADKVGAADKVGITDFVSTAASQLERSLRADAVYTLCTPRHTDATRFIRATPVMI